jgi:serine phosphatase RsbU (regulator of sigma subunit)
LVKQLNFTSYMCAPLSARGRALGALTLVSTHADRRYGAVDLELAEEVARRASLVIDNARLLHEQTRIARALQSALLPPSLPTINGLQLSACYRAAGEGNTVGGDFYDVFDLGRGAWAAVIGDVSGTGPEAAAITGLVRHALRASGLSDRDPASMLRTANTMLATHDKGTGERFCSACVAVIRMGTPVRIVLASAGHCPPVVLRAAGGAEVLTCEGGLLGISGELDIRSRRATLGPGDRLLLHTDGLTEARDQEGRFYGEERFAKALVAGASAAPEALVASLLADVEEFSTGEHTDDLAVLVLGPNQP